MMNLSKYAKIIEWAQKNYPNSDILASISPNQLNSKKWLVDELTKMPHIHGPWFTPAGFDHGGNIIEIVGSWYCYPLVDLLKKEFKIRRIDCWDIDFEARQISEQYNNIFGATDVNIFGQDYFQHERNGSQANLLINTSSEHMKETFWMMDKLYGEPQKHLDGKRKFYIKGTCMVAIQSNNMRHIPEHINCVESVEELIDKHRINKVLYSGEQNMVEWDGFQIVNSEFKRFMVIGKL